MDLRTISPPRPRAVDWVAAAVVAVLGLLGMTDWVPFLSGVDLGVHEFGHLVTAWAPELVTAAMGSVMQVVAPLALAGYFGLVRGERPVAAGILAWTATNLTAVARYVADAPYEDMPLFGGEDALHDWALILGPEHCNCLGNARPLSQLLIVTAWLVLIVAGVVALWRVPSRRTGESPS